MTSHSIDKALNRIRILQNQIGPSDDCLRELSTFSFDLEKVSNEVRNMRPELFFKIQDLTEKHYEGRGPGYHQVSKEEHRYESNKLVLSTIQSLLKDEGLTAEWIINNLDEFTRSCMSTGCINGSAGTKYSVHYFLYTKTLKNLGTERHREYLLRGATCTDLGAFGMTELGHGSNVQAVETTAHYDHETSSFIMNSPTETSIKFWIGNLGKTCSMIVIFAQLILDNENHGVHVFLVPVRQRETHDIYEGITIGDCGDKIGLQGIDNGWIKFTNYRIGKEMLLNKFADVNDEGLYVSSIPKAGKRFAYHMAALSGGRLLAAVNAADISLVCSITAIRYSACRKQFARKRDQEEATILDYPLHQARLLPDFARGYLESIAMQYVWNEYTDLAPKLSDPSDKAGEYFHLLSSALKAITTWNCSDTWRESRLACGGMGYSYLNNFAELGAISDVNQTWEGENYVLIQQACKLLLKNFTNLMRGKETMKTCEFMTSDTPEEYKFEGSFSSLNDIGKLFSYQANKCVHEAIFKIQTETMKEKEMRLSKGEIWEKHLYYTFIPMVKAYLQRYILITYIKFLEKFNDSPKSKEVLGKLALLHFSTEIIKNEGMFRDTISKEQIEDLKERCIGLSQELRPEIVALTFTVPFKDNTYGSIGKSNMQPYAEFMKGVVNTPDCFGKPKKWSYLYQSKI